MANLGFYSQEPRDITRELEILEGKVTQLAEINKKDPTALKKASEVLKTCRDEVNAVLEPPTNRPGLS